MHAVAHRAANRPPRHPHWESHGRDAGTESGIVAWERTLRDVFSDAGYATMCLGKRHIGDCDGRWPTDHGFDESHMLEGRKGEKLREAAQLTVELKVKVDVDYKRRAFRFMEAQAQRPFRLCFNHSLMHIPVVPLRRAARQARCVGPA
jgi:arylsulfatase A-like enzyme